MQGQEAGKNYTFNFDWQTVVKGFWSKYPCPEISFIKWNKVVDLEILSDNTLRIKRIALTQKFKYLWGLGLEVVDVDFRNTVLDMQTNFLGLEYVKYKGINLQQTRYEKFFRDESSFVVKYANQFNTSFGKGIQVIEDKCREFVSQKQRT